MADAPLNPWMTPQEVAEALRVELDELADYASDPNWGPPRTATSKGEMRVLRSDLLHWLDNLPPSNPMCVPVAQFWQCTVCGASIVDVDLHETWHLSLR